MPVKKTSQEIREKVSTHLDLVVGAVKLGHALDFGEGNGVTILEAMPDLIQGGDKSTLRLLGDAGNHCRDWLLPSDVTDYKLRAKVIENLGVEAWGVSDDERDVVLPEVKATIINRL